MTEATSVPRRFVTRKPALAALIVVLALVLRVAFVLHDGGYRPYGDAAAFDQVAVSLATHSDYPPSIIAPRGGPSAFRPPAYPFLLAGAYEVTGSAHSS